MTENMKKFLELVSKNEELSKKLNGASKEEIIAMTKELGVELTDADFEQSNELSDDELDAVAGGGECACAVGGGGTGGGRYDDKTCACVMGGGGENKDGKCRCVCICGGIGGEGDVF